MLGVRPVGLAVIAVLAAVGIEPVVAADLSPAGDGAGHGRRTRWSTRPPSRPSTPGPEPAGRGLVVFEAVGVPGIIDDVLRRAPARSRVVVVAVQERDTIRRSSASPRSSTCASAPGTTRWSSPDACGSIAEGELNVTPMITGEVDLDGVPGAFADLAHPDEHCKIVVVP